MASSSNMGRLVLPLAQLRPAITANRVEVLVFHSTSKFVADYRTIGEGQDGFREDFQYYGKGAEI